MPPRARALIESALGGTPYLARAIELYEIALAGHSDESIAIWTEHGGVVSAVALVGMVAGAVGAGRIHLMIGDDPHLTARACDVLRAMGARLAVAEWPDDAVFAPAVEQIREYGFVEEARIPEYYRAGVDQVTLRREL
jgi:hypothetical protein